MRYIAWFLVVLTVLALGALVFFWQGAMLEVVETSVQAFSAAEQRETFDSIGTAVAEGSFAGPVYQQANYLVPSTFEFVTYGVRLRNNGLLPAEWIQLSIVPEGADILALNEARGYSLGSLGGGTITATMLAYAGTDRARSAIVTYYVWGRSFQIKTTIR